MGTRFERKGAYEWADMTSALCACTASTLYATIGVKTMSTWVCGPVSVELPPNHKTLESLPLSR
jgi:hypothetical protein